MHMDKLIKISTSSIVFRKFRKHYKDKAAKIEISEKPDKKYKIYNPKSKKWFHFGSTQEDYTKHKDTLRLIHFRLRNVKWSTQDLYTPGYASYWLLW